MKEMLSEKFGPVVLEEFEEPLKKMQLGFDAHEQEKGAPQGNSPNQMAIYHQGQVDEEALVKVFPEIPCTAAPGIPFFLHYGPVTLALAASRGVWQRYCGKVLGRKRR